MCTPFANVNKTAGVGETCGDGILCRKSTCNDATKTCEDWKSLLPTPLPPKPVCE